MAFNISHLTVPVYISKRLITDDFSVRIVEAARINDIPTVLKLLRKTVDPNIRDEYGSTALVNACEAGNVEIVRILLQNGAHVNLPSICGVTPLHAAAKGNHVEAVRLLLLAGAKPELQTMSRLYSIDKTQYCNASWNMINDAAQGELPEEVPEENDLLDLPGFCIPAAKSRSNTKGKKGKKGKKGAKAKGKKGKKGKKKK